jgi:hypothetical protein
MTLSTELRRVGARMTDDELIGYADIHCETPRAIFHVNHINRLIRLAGNPNGLQEFEHNPDSPFFHAHENFIKPLVKLARERTLLEAGNG